MSVPKLIETGDGTHSLYLRDMNETYHSTHGALSESKYVFLEKGVQEFIRNNQPKRIDILEVGFGTGLNVLMMLDFARNNRSLDIHLTTLEPFPLAKEIYDKLNFANHLEHIDHKDLIALHEVVDQEVWKDENFTFQKYINHVQEEELNQIFDIIFFDAFAPSKQAEMWELSVFQKLYGCLSNKGILATYCAQGQFKRNLKEAGFEVETLEGPPGKKEMVRGRKG